jgi:hypothetical protein
MTSPLLFDPDFDFHTDARGGDPDKTSPTLRKYHQLLWKKPLPDGSFFDLNIDSPGKYLYHQSSLGTFSLGSDAIFHSYQNQKSKGHILENIPEHVADLLKSCSNIGSYIIFPNNRIGGQPTINQSRGLNKYINDRFDLTLECIRRFYRNEKSPLSDTLNRYHDFFKLFVNFDSYVSFFLLQDLIDENMGAIKFYLPFNNFTSHAGFSCESDYLQYKQNLIAFNAGRKQRMVDYVKYLMSDNMLRNQ